MARNRKRRLRYGPLPLPAERADLYWGVSQPELQGLTDGQVTALLMAAPEFEQVLGPKLEEIDARSRTVRGKTSLGRPTRWSARQLESVLLYRRVAGVSQVKEALRRLTCDPSALALLGLGKRLPSEPTLTRYQRQHFDPDERADLYRELDRQLRQRVIRLPGFEREAQVLGMDGSQHGTRYTPPIPERGRDGKPTGNLINGHIPAGEPGAITAPDAGFVGGNNPKSGKGWQFIGLFSEHGTLLAWEVSPLNESERETAARVLENYEREVLPVRDPSLFSVCTADGGFSSPEMRRQLQDLRIAPNIHKASHGSQSSAQRQKAKLAEQWAPFYHPGKAHYSYWFANGHAEICCACGQGQTERVFQIGKNQALTIATKGKCKDCGNVTITAGKWRRAKNPSRYVRASKAAEADPAIGNPLTFNDPISRKYGYGRFGWGESVHATLSHRFGLLDAKSRQRSIVEVITEFAITGSVISVLLLERAARKNGDGTTFPERASAELVELELGEELDEAA